MKKRSILKRVLMVLCFGSMMTTGCLMSCSDNNVIENQCQTSSQSMQSPYKELEDALDVMSIEFFDNHAVEINTRSIFSRLWNAVVADVKCIKNYNDTHPNPGGPVIPVQETASASSLAYRLNTWHVQGHLGTSGYFTPKRIDIIDSLSKVYKYKPNTYDIATAHNAVILKMMQEPSWHPQNVVSLAESSTRKAKELGVVTFTDSINSIVSNVQAYMTEYEEETHHIPTTKPEVQNDAYNYMLDNYFYYVSRITDPKLVAEYTDGYILTACEQMDKLGNKRIEAQKKYLIQLLKLGSASYDLWYNIDRVPCECE